MKIQVDSIRDFKKFTSKAMIRAVKDNPKESRKEWLLLMFEQVGTEKSNVEKYQFWQHHNHPIEHKNPVVCDFVIEPEEWKYSSARNFAGDNTVLEIDEIGFLG